MSMFFRNWLPEGFYEEDNWGELTRLDNPDDIKNAQKSGKLYQHDGVSMGKIDNVDIEEINME